MRKDLKTTWVNALESDEYIQGTGQLKKDNKFCCLGVLIDACKEPGYTITNGGRDINHEGYNPLYRGIFNLPEDQVNELWKMNDDPDDPTESNSFKVIAKWIRENVSESEEEGTRV